MLAQTSREADAAASRNCYCGRMQFNLPLDPIPLKIALGLAIVIIGLLAIWTLWALAIRGRGAGLDRDGNARVWGEALISALKTCRQIGGSHESQSKAQLTQTSSRPMLSSSIAAKQASKTVAANLGSACWL